MKREDFRFFHRLRVRWAEVDMQKIVFNAHYLMYLDTAVADYWRVLALPYEEAMAVCRQITELGRALWQSGHKVTVPAVDLLGIEAGEYETQRFVYHFFMK